MDNNARFGFVNTVETLDRNCRVIDVEVVKNLIPIEGLNYLLNTGLKGGAQSTTWYIGLYEGLYTPIPADTAATFPASATELTAYSETTRQLLTLGTVAAGAADNSASRGVFTGTTNGKFAQGGFISSAAAKGATTGVLISAVRFSSPKPIDNGGVLRVTAAFTSVST